MTEERPGLTRKIWFWALLGMSSTFFAEVTVGSAPFPFFDPFGLLVVVPLYSLHILVLGTVVVRGRKVTLDSLFVAGILFGLYEAYITKVIWDPYWEFGTTVHVAEVAVIQTAMLVLWYHNFFAFIVPLAAVETFCTRSRKVFSALPARVRLRFRPEDLLRTIVLLGVLFGLFQATAAHGPLVSALSVGGSGAVLFAALTLFNVTGKGVRWTMDDLLPDARQFRVLLAALVAFYAITIPLLLPENLPGPVGHVVILLAYAGVFVLLWRLLRMNGPSPREPEATGTGCVAPSISDRHALMFLAVYGVTASLMGFVAVVAGLAALSMHIAGVCVGVFVLAMAVRRALSRA